MHALKIFCERAVLRPRDINILNISISDSDQSKNRHFNRQLWLSKMLTLFNPTSSISVKG